ncbi:DsbA family oxidoreductase [Novosphingobium sp. G106]|uniref:DsbA family oxidoreductase n=1 Tax=Novosphingobium sp. G106 TaxID=2849500 RepID=UPI001C2D8B6A|nr:DsbA family oxidoreductase [Novosphingobium sp. G106]MBV1689182.1 DsbA family oxidoreductase [Novosphingobium sp. G106]
MSARVTIDIFSDVMCPWCVIGYKQLEKALAGLAGEIEAEVRWRPFELNPDMPSEGEDMAAHMLRKYGRAPDAASSAQMTEMAARAGYEMRYLGPEPEPERRLRNTFLAHKLLRWALTTGGPEVQTRLKLTLFDAYFQQRRDVSDRAVLLDVAAGVGLDRAGAEAALDDEALGHEVREEELEARAAEINAVPAMIVNGRYLIPGAQEPETYANVLRKAVERA